MRLDANLEHPPGLVGDDGIEELGLLDRTLERRLALVVAPGGFGKTTLLASWQPAGHILAWVSLEYVQLYGGDQLVYLRWPSGLFSVSFVIGPLLAALAYLVTFWREVRGQREASGRGDPAP